MRRSKEYARQLLKLRIQAAKALGIRTRKKKIPRQNPPKAIEVAYFVAIRDTVLAKARALVVERVIPRLAAWEREAKAFRGDSLDTEVTAAVDTAAEDFFAEFPNEKLKTLARRFGDRTSDYQRSEWIRQVRAGLGVDPLLNEPWLAPKLATFAAENAALIKSATRDYFSGVEQTILRGLQAGTRPADLEAEIADRFQIGEDRAALIARDQVGKLTGALNQTRQEEAGIEKFMWETAHDERVRESHADLDGEVFPWSDPPFVDGEVATPGFPIMCRCIATAVFSEEDSDA